MNVGDTIRKSNQSVISPASFLSLSLTFSGLRGFFFIKPEPAGGVRMTLVEREKGFWRASVRKSAQIKDVIE